MPEDQASRLRVLARGVSQANSQGMRIIAVTSGKGGVGKTNISVNLALALTELGRKVIVFDGDLGLANIDVVCGISPKYTLEDVVLGNSSLSEVLVDGPNGIKILPGGSGSGLLVNLEQRSLQNVLEKLQSLDGLADILLIDTGAGIARGVIQLLEGSDEIILVATPEPTSLTDAYGLVKTLYMRGNKAQIGVVINRVNSRDEAESTFSRLSLVLDRFLKYKVEYLGFIYEDHFLTKAVMTQTPVSVAFPTAPATLCIQWIAKNLLGIIGKSASPARGVRGFVESLMAHFFN